MKKFKLVTFFLICVALTFTACGGPYYFDLYIKPQKNLTSLKIPKVLLVEDIETNETFWNQRMAYRSSPYQIKYFIFKQWAKRPSELIKDTIVHFYKNSLLFEKVIERFSTMEPDITMKVNIDALEMSHQKKNWFAHLALDIEIIDAKNEKIILTHFFDRKKRLKGKKTRYVPEKISEILQEELLKIVKKLNQI